MLKTVATVCGTWWFFNSIY